ncbi:fumarylacetoacetate hydrolase family protein [Planctomyces sp. SH-PL62]|uniref:fumarylacetoacetate hydrolase family protein n=1 Tax=Planctomyces sp. SH-PL62 TaxID=1636152 RepID=UPI00078CB50A|nr:fumarylacetoacetate hydrolase family protein [Planctomyces sp. SH-PL62]AMV39601.1 Ureidoglycolate lyase [Planctomyces sp. SH-PL62]
MHLVKFATDADPTPRVGLLQAGEVAPLGAGPSRLSEILHGVDPAATVAGLADRAVDRLKLDSIRLLPPMDRQEVWGAGVTYERSKTAREEESRQAATFYDLVYRAERPELFFKATPHRVVGPGEPIRIRRDARWTVPEPELALVLSPKLELVGFTIGNDVSSRDIEGENPLYLPQAKVYDGCCALGPAIILAASIADPSDLEIRLEIRRSGEIAFEGKTSTSRMARRYEDLIAWLGRDQSFPEGVILLTGTGIIPPDEFALRSGDVVRIEIEGLGRLENPALACGEATS